MPTVTVSTSQEVKLASSVRRKILTKLGNYKQLKTQLDGIKAAMKVLTEELGAIRDDATGEMSLDLDGNKITLVAGTYKKFNPKTFVANGGDLAIYNLSIDEKPKKAYNKITLAGDKDEEE